MSETCLSIPARQISAACLPRTGKWISAKVIVDQFTNRSRGFGFIEMSNREEGLKAIQELDSKDLGGRSLKVNEAKPKTDSRGRRRRRWRRKIPLVINFL